MTHAINIINRMKEYYCSDRFQFDFYIAQFLSGNGNKQLRRGIVKQLTGEDRPASKCGMYAVSDILKSSFEQYQMQF